MKPRNFFDDLFAVVGHPLFEFAVPIFILGLDASDGESSLAGFFTFAACWFMGVVHGAGITIKHFEDGGR